MIFGPDTALLLRKERLLSRSAALRGDIAAQSAVLERPLAAADRVRAGAHWAYRQRGWIAGAAVAVWVVRPRRAFRGLRFAWWLWRRVQRARPWLALAGSLMAATTARPRRWTGANE